MIATRQFLEILKKQRKGLASAEEEEFLRTYYNLFELEPEVLATMDVTEKDAIRNRIEGRLDAAMAAPEPRGGLFKLWQRYSIAGWASTAAAVLLVIAGLWLFNGNRLKQYPETAFQNDVNPGKNIATLTLPNGKTITLSDAQRGIVIGGSDLKYNDGSVVERLSAEVASGDAALLTAATPRGGTYQVILPDGTKVWLNAASSLKFPSTFTGLDNRKVELSGEAYFEVSKDKAHPFIVKTHEQLVEVLGTHFNISSYADERETKTTLLEGSVQVVPLQKPAQKKVLKPGEQAVLTNEYLNILPVDVEVATAWKNGNFLFRNEQLESILKRLAYWYDVDIIYVGEKPDLKLAGVIKRDRKLSEVLELISHSGGVKFKIEGRKVYVTK